MSQEFIDAVLEFARNSVGEQEISGNQGFESERFETLMKQVGWQKGQAWCAYFAEACWTVPTYKGKSKYLSEMQRLFSGGAVATYNNFKRKGGELFTVSKEPEEGAVVIWQKHKVVEDTIMPHWSGHAGIVESIIDENTIECIEGNTNDSGGREGIEVARKVRRVDFTPKAGLVMKGFIKLA